MSEEKHPTARSTVIDGDPQASSTAWIGIITALIVIDLVLFLQAFYFGEVRRENRIKIDAAAPLDLTQMRAEQERLLNGYRWIDKTKGIVGIPIEAGIGRVLANPDAWPVKEAARASTKGTSSGTAGGGR